MVLPTDGGVIFSLKPINLLYFIKIYSWGISCKVLKKEGGCGEFIKLIPGGKDQGRLQGIEKRGFPFPQKDKRNAFSQAFWPIINP